MEILVTGGAGSIGSALVQELLEHNHNVRVMDKAIEKLRRLDNPNLALIQGGIEDKEKALSATRGVDVVYHLAESFSKDPYEVLNIDIQGNLNMLTAAVASKVKHFIFMSTHRVYGRPRHNPVNEDHPLHPEESGRPVYGAAKVANEKLCLAWWHDEKLPVTIFRPWWSFYPGIRGKVLRSMIDAALAGKIIYVPEQSGGNFIHHRDATLALRLAMLKEPAYGHCFNLHSGVFVTWRLLAEMVIVLTGSKSKLEFITSAEMSKDPLNGTDESVYYECRMDGGKAERLLGYKSNFTPEELKQQLKETIGRLVSTRKKK